MRIEGVDDALGFAETRAAFLAVGLGCVHHEAASGARQQHESYVKKERAKQSAEYFETIGRCLAATLHLGNISFDAVVTAASGDRACAVSSTNIAAQPALRACAAALGVDPPERLEQLLVLHQIKAPSSSSSSPLSNTTNTNQSASSSCYTLEHDTQTAVQMRDACAKEIYARMFRHVVASLGRATTGTVALHHRAPPSPSSPFRGEKTTRLDFIGVLDIFGFESFERNDLEQLLINFANESLQSAFNRAVLVHEREVYRSEGLDDRCAHSFDQDPTLDRTELCVALLSSRKEESVFKLLDDCTKTNKSEDFFCRELHEKISKLPDCAHKGWVKPHMRLVKDTFVIEHYARKVHYTVGHFVSKNANKIPTGLDDLLKNSTLFGTLLCDPAGGGEALVSAKSSSASAAAAAAAANTTTVSMQFSLQMRTLCALLDSTSCSFVRCVKPNARMAVGVFERSFVAAQLRAQGIPQTCEVLKLGMPTRVLFEDLEQRYRASCEQQLREETSGSSTTTRTPLSALDARASLGRLSREHITVGL